MKFIKFPNGKVWRTVDSSVIGTVVIENQEAISDVAQLHKAISVAATGDANFLEDIKTQARGVSLVAFTAHARALADSSGVALEELHADSKELAQALQEQYALSYVEVTHALSNLGSVDDYEDECVVDILDTPRQLRCPSYPEECSYVRVTVDGLEVAYWDSQEWQEDPTVVMGAFMGAARGAPMVSNDTD